MVAGWKAKGGSVRQDDWREEILRNKQTRLKSKRTSQDCSGSKPRPRIWTLKLHNKRVGMSHPEWLCSAETSCHLNLHRQSEARNQTRFAYNYTVEYQSLREKTCVLNVSRCFHFSERFLRRVSCRTRNDGSSPLTALTGIDWGLQSITAEFHSFGKHFFPLPNVIQADTRLSLTLRLSGNDKE